MASDDVKLPLYYGSRTEDLEEYWFLCEEVSTVKKFQDEDIKKGQLPTTF